ncbi:MAG: hypothetical protein SNJ70_05760, partial [Armatimonadota bacterium]
MRKIISTKCSIPKFLLLTFLLAITSTYLSANTPLSAENKVHSKLSNTHITLQKYTFSTNEDVKVEWHNLPGNKTDWITVVPQ